MKFHIPFTLTRIEKLRTRAKFFLSFVKHKTKSKLGENLKNSGVNISRQEYLAIALRTLVISFIFLTLFATTILALLKIKLFYLYGVGLALVFSLFVFFSQMSYPKVYVAKRQRNIEKNLISALEDMLIQLTSGIPLFSVMTNISSTDYGELSIEFKKAVKRINAGESETDVLEELGKNNPSVFFRRTIWQISNGLKTGSDMGIVIKDSIKALNEEQLIQIQNYGNKLNPLIMFYMLISVIIPALSATFLTILSSMLNIPSTMVTMLFVGLFIFVILIQIMFLGVIKTRRPSLL